MEKEDIKPKKRMLMKIKIMKKGGEEDYEEKSKVRVVE
jgi:hypothetical protein